MIFDSPSGRFEHCEGADVPVHCALCSDLRQIGGEEERLQKTSTDPNAVIILQFYWGHKGPFQNLKKSYIFQPENQECTKDHIKTGLICTEPEWPERINSQPNDHENSSLNESTYLPFSFASSQYFPFSLSNPTTLFYSFSPFLFLKQRVCTLV